MCKCTGIGKHVRDVLICTSSIFTINKGSAKSWRFLQGVFKTDICTIRAIHRWKMATCCSLNLTSLTWRTRIDVPCTSFLLQMKFLFRLWKRFMGGTHFRIGMPSTDAEVRCQEGDTRARYSNLAIQIICLQTANSFRVYVNFRCRLYIQVAESNGSANAPIALLAELYSFSFSFFLVSEC